MLKSFIFSIIILISTFLLAQDNKSSGNFHLGIRSTVSSFSDDGASGFGFGGQYRLRILNQLNSEFYADLIKTDIHNLAKREDIHIGWSILGYPFKKNNDEKFTPYILTGHCFDFSKVTKNSNGFNEKKFASAVQLGIGCHYNLTKNFDISLTAQYMMHLGKHIHAEVFEIDGVKDINIEKEKIQGIEGHMLINVNFNVLLFDMWGKK